MKIITLLENLVYKKGLMAEHGLSILIETPSKRILFDTGQSGVFLENAKKMGFDMKSVDALVLSHGHYDHTGGLYHFLEKNSKATVFSKKELFMPKFHSLNRFIGTKKEEEKLNGRFVAVEKPTEIDTNVFIMPDIGIHHEIDTNFEGFHVKEGDHFLPDRFRDELYIIIIENNRMNIITACSHRGITNITSSALESYDLPVNLILGGFHMKNCEKNQYDHIVGHFNELLPKKIGVCHCTGVDRYAELKKDIQTDLFYNHTGNIITL